jgi:excisionase family DNA binding protein
MANPKNENAEPHALTVNELMSRWQCPRKKVLEAIHEGRLAAFRVGRRVYRVTVAEVERFETARAA